MKRIGLAASKIAKGNLTLYNLCVVLISSLFSLFIFVVAGAIVVLALVIISYVGDQVSALEFKHDWTFMLSVCMAALTVVTVLFNLLALSKNIRFPRKDLTLNTGR